MDIDLRNTKYYLIFKHIDMLVFQFQNLIQWNSCTSYGIEKCVAFIITFFENIKKWKYRPNFQLFS